MNNTEEQLPKVRKKAVSKSLSFVEYIINRCDASNGLRAALRRADNPSTEYQSWEVLAGFNINLEYENERLPYVTIAADIARTNATKNGSTKIGQAIARCYSEGNADDQAKMKLRRLLACGTVTEACRILRPLFGLIEARADVSLDYASLLNDLIWFGYEDNENRVKARWAQAFYGNFTEINNND